MNQKRFRFSLKMFSNECLLNNIYRNNTGREAPQPIIFELFPGDLEPEPSSIPPHVTIIKVDKHGRAVTKPTIDDRFIHNEDYTFVTFKNFNGQKEVTLTLNNSEALVFRRLHEAYLIRKIPWVSAPVLMESIHDYQSVSKVFKNRKDWKNYIQVHPDGSLYRLNIPFE